MNATARSFLLFSLMALGCTTTTVGPDDDIIPNPDLDDATLEIVGSDRISVSTNSETNLRVRYLDQDGDPVDGAVNFTIDGTDGGATLSGRNIDTDDEGIATISLRTRDLAQFRVVAAAAAADPVEFMINVTEGEIVTLLVTPEYSGMRAIADVYTGVFSNYTCGEFASLVPTPQEVQSGRLGETREFSGIDTASPIAVYSLGYNSRDFVATFRCVDVDFDAGNEVAFEMADVTDLQGGVFDMTETFDVTDGFPPAVNFILDAMSGLTTDPANWLIDLAIESDLLPGVINELLDGSRIVVAGYINDAIASINRPDYVDDILEAGAELDRVFTELTIAGTLSISEANEFGEGIAVHRLRELRVPVGEETITRPLRDQRVDDVGVVFADGMQIIDEHTFMVSLGEVMGIVINDIILPRLPGSPNSMSELLGQLINCEGLGDASFIPEDTSDSIRRGLETLCEAGINLAGSRIDDQLEELLDWDTLTLAGEGMTMDDDQDYRADEFEGTANASWAGGPGGTLDFEGELRGVREGEQLEREVDRVKAKFDEAS
ncbi:MAG: hypothetical protein AB8H86_12220 [Polyangiales bacterium]